MKKKLKDSPEILTVKQLADYLQMDEHTIYRLAKSGKIPAMKIEAEIIPFLNLHPALI